MHPRLAHVFLWTLDPGRLEPLFDEAYGPDASREHMQYFEDMVEGEQTAYALDGETVL